MTPTTTDVSGVDFVALQVSDLERSRRFWIESVGLEAAPQAPPGAVVFATTPIPFAITTPKVDLRASTRLGWGVSLWIRIEDPDALCAKLKGQGVPILAEVSEGKFGRQFTFADPDGYAFVAHGRA
ncbi:MAG TPA: VOC family protein [Thermoplasmata archaeon]|nr:VOC family protein [Thermoplasmata archaeon]